MDKPGSDIWPATLFPNAPQATLATLATPPSSFLAPLLPLAGSLAMATPTFSCHHNFIFTKSTNLKICKCQQSCGRGLATSLSMQFLYRLNASSHLIKFTLIIKPNLTLLLRWIFFMIPQKSYLALPSIRHNAN